MKVTIVLNGVVEFREVPTSWDQVSYNTFLKLELVEPVDVLCALWDLDKETLKRCEIRGFDDVAFALRFVKEPIDVTVLPKQIAGCEVPKDLNFDQVGRYWDIKMIFDSCVKDGKFIPELSRFPEIVAIAVMPDYLDATKEQQDAFTTKIGDQPCGEVLAIGNFCLTKLHLLSTATAPSSTSTTTAKKNWRLAMTSSFRNLAITVRLWYWRKKLLSTAKKYSR